MCAFLVQLSRHVGVYDVSNGHWWIGRGLEEDQLRIIHSSSKTPTKLDKGEGSLDGRKEK